MKKNFALIIIVFLIISVTIPVYGGGYFINQDNSFSDIAFSVVSFLLVIVLAYFATKFIAKKSSNLANSSNIQMIDHINLGHNNRIMIVKIYNNLYILAVNNNRIDVIDNLQYDADNLINKESKNDKSTQTFNYIENFIKGKNNRKKMKNLNIEASLLNDKLESLKSKVESIKKKD